MPGAPAAAARRGAALPFGAMIEALKRDPGNLGILIACTAASVAAVFEPTYLTLSTSAIQTWLRAPNSQAPMILTVAFLVLALFTLLVGTLGDLFGRRRLLLIGLVGLTASNALGLLLLDAPRTFAIADLFNTFFGVMVLPAAVAIVTLTFEPAIRPFAYGILFGIQGTALVLASLLISMLGGVWEGKATFIPVLVIGVAAIVLVLRRVPESRAPGSMRRGTAIVNLGLMAGLFVLMFIVIAVRVRSEQVLLGLVLVLAFVLLAALAGWLWRRLRHFKGVAVHGGRDVGLAIFAGLMMMFAQGCFFYQTIPYFWDVQKVGDTEGALRYLPYVIGLLAGGMIVARLSFRFGARRILAASFTLTGLALLGLSLLKVDSPYWVMIVPIALVGLAGGLGGPARTTVVLGSPPEGLVNSSSAVNTAAGQAGYALGVIASSVLVTRYADRLFTDGLAAAGVSADTVARISAELANPISRLLVAGYPGLPEAVTAVTGVSYANAFTSGMTTMFFFVAIAMFGTALVVFFGMHRGLRATFAVPLKEEASPVGADEFAKTSPDVGAESGKSPEPGNADPVLTVGVAAEAKG